MVIKFKHSDLIIDLNDKVNKFVIERGIKPLVPYIPEQK